MLLETQLFKAHFDSDPPNGEDMFTVFSRSIVENNSIYNNGNSMNDLDMHALPLVMRAKAVAAPPSMG